MFRKATPWTGSGLLSGLLHADTTAHSGVRVRGWGGLKSYEVEGSAFGEIFSVVLRGAGGSRVLENNKYKREPSVSGKVTCKASAPRCAGVSRWACATCISDPRAWWPGGGLVGPGAEDV